MILVGEILVLSLAAVGLVAICWKLADILLEPQYQTAVTMVLPLHGHVENLEQQLRYFASRFKKMSKTTEVGWVICLDAGMDEETRILCETICDRYPFMNLCTRAQMEKLIS